MVILPVVEVACSYPTIMKQFVYKFYDELYQVSVHFIIGGNSTEAEAYILEESGEKAEFDSIDDSQIRMGFVWSVPGNKTSKNVPGYYLYWEGNRGSMLTHELFHLTENVLRDRGLTPVEAWGEAGAYYIAFLQRAVMNAIDDHRRSERKKNASTKSRS